MHLKSSPSGPAMPSPELGLYWLAGLLEGEGSFVKGPPSRPGCPIVQLSITDEDVVQRAARLFSRSVSTWDRIAVRPRKRVYITRIKGAAAVLVMQRLRPVMGSRRQRQIDGALAASHVTTLRTLLRGMTCTESACESPVRTRGLCRQHYNSWWKSRKYGRTPRYRPIDVLPPAAAGTDLSLPIPSDDAATAWLAGLLEGEGTFADARGYPRISATMCDHEVLSRAAAILGVTNVSPKDELRNVERGWSPAFQIKLAGARGAEWMRLLRPHMGGRRTREIDQALGAYHPIRLTEAPRRCVLPGCDRPHRSRGLCHTHYMKWHRDRKAGKAPRIRPLR